MLLLLLCHARFCGGVYRALACDDGFEWGLCPNLNITNQ